MTMKMNPNLHKGLRRVLYLVPADQAVTNDQVAERTGFARKNIASRMSELHSLGLVSQDQRTVPWRYQRTPAGEIWLAEHSAVVISDLPRVALEGQAP